jgi:carbon storage regulator
MLILGRRRGERITIQTSDGIITVMPVMFDENQVRIGIDAPKHIAVDRHEVYLRKQEEAVPVSFLRKVAKALRG